MGGNETICFDLKQVASIVLVDAVIGKVAPTTDRASLKGFALSDYSAFIADPRKSGFVVRVL